LNDDEVSPQKYLDHVMSSRGYSTEKYKTLQTGYHNKPTVLQNASYDLYLIGIVRSCIRNRSNDDVYTEESLKLQEILQSGISPNPCNSYGESLVHLICRLGDQQLLEIMIGNGCSIQLSDDYGRTPLHDAFWSAEPALEVVTTLLFEDLHLIQMTDCRGSLPLDYVRSDHWGIWKNFIHSKKDIFWPNLLSGTSSTASNIVAENAVIHDSPNSRPLPDPIHALPLDLAKQVASGKLKPGQAMYLRDQREKIDRVLLSAQSKSLQLIETKTSLYHADAKNYVVEGSDLENSVNEITAHLDDDECNNDDDDTDSSHTSNDSTNHDDSDDSSFFSDDDYEEEDVDFMKDMLHVAFLSQHSS
jgi:hypothetical protein